MNKPPNPPRPEVLTEDEQSSNTSNERSTSSDYSFATSEDLKQVFDSVAPTNKTFVPNSNVTMEVVLSNSTRPNNKTFRGGPDESQIQNPSNNDGTFHQSMMNYSANNLGLQGQGKPCNKTFFGGSVVDEAPKANEADNGNYLPHRDEPSGSSSNQSNDRHFKTPKSAKKRKRCQNDLENASFGEGPVEQLMKIIVSRELPDGAKNGALISVSSILDDGSHVDVRVLIREDFVKALGGMLEHKIKTKDDILPNILQILHKIADDAHGKQLVDKHCKKSLKSLADQNAVIRKATEVLHNLQV